MINGLKQKIMSTTPKDILITAALGGAIAGISGIATLLDKYVYDYTLGFKSKKSDGEVLLRGAALGALFGLPMAYISQKNIGPSDFGGTHSALKYFKENDRSLVRDYVKTRHTHRLTPPNNYVYTTDEAGRQILILDPKTGF